MLTIPLQGAVVGSDFWVPLFLFGEGETPVEGALYSDMSLTLVDPGASVPDAYVPTALEFVELGLGFYKIKIPAAKLITAGTAQFLVKHIDDVSTLFKIVVASVVSPLLTSAMFYDIVRDALGNALAYMTVNVYESLTTNLLYTTQTGYDGSYSIPYEAVQSVVLVDIEIINAPTTIVKRERIKLF